jgi:outer membrane protein TolC
MKAVRGLWLGLAACAGCATAPPVSDYTHLSREWEQQRPRAEAAADGDIFTGAANLERAELVRQVLARNPSLAAAHHAWRAALERYPQVTSLDDPRLGYAIAPRTLGASDFDPSQRFELAQRIPFPGKRALAGAAALADAEATAHDFAAARLRLAALASAAFDDYYVAWRGLAISREHADLLQLHQGSALARYAAGSASQQDPLQAEVEIAMLARQELELQNQLDSARARINVLLRREPDRPLPPPPARLSLPASSAGETPELPARPDVAAAAARVRARQAELAAAQRAFLPDVTLMGVYDQLWEESELRPMLGFEIELPVQLARRRAGVREARARLGQAESEATGIADGARLEQLRARQELERARRLRALYESDLLPTARERVVAARAGFESGRNGFAELVDAEHELRSLRLGAEEALAEESRRSAELSAALGELPGLPGERP